MGNFLIQNKINWMKFKFPSHTTRLSNTNFEPNQTLENYLNLL